MILADSGSGSDGVHQKEFGNLKLLFIYLKCIFLLLRYALANWSPFLLVMSITVAKILFGDLGYGYSKKF
jgi:hypothetical protein